MSQGIRVALYNSIEMVLSFSVFAVLEVKIMNDRSVQIEGGHRIGQQNYESNAKSSAV